MERMKFYEFSYKLTAVAKIKLPLASVVAPVLYQSADKYYNACVNYLNTGEMDDLSFEKYSIEKIIKNMNASYIEALMILQNIENNPELAFMIYVPEVVE